jgi:hypothetical protein
VLLKRLRESHHENHPEPVLLVGAPRQRRPGARGPCRVIPTLLRANRSAVSVSKVARAQAICFGLLALCCASAGPYGFSPHYEPLNDEANAATDAETLDLSLLARAPDQLAQVKTSTYGIVKARRDGPDGTANVTLSVRVLQDRNLCESDAASSCRVTVSEREHAVVHALLALRPDDALGEKSLNVGSLVRVIGTLTDRVDSSDGLPTLRASYYRHWPRNYFVTTSARSYMRR